jgi:hypothetical protein
MDMESWPDDRQTVQQPQRLALKRLGQLIEVLIEDEKSRTAQAKPQPGEGGGTGGATGGDGIPPLAQLKLLRALQAEVNERTTAFDATHPDRSKLTPEQQSDLDAIRTAQAELAALLEEISPAVPPAGEKP